VTDFVVVVTGGARGIGLATSRAFAQAGARVVIADIDIDTATGSAAQFGAEAKLLDVRESGSWAGLVTDVGDIDVLVNNAGVAHGGLFVETPPELRELQIDVNLRGVVNGMGAVLPGMIARGRGHVVNVASLAGRLATPHAAVYTATKFAVIGLTEAVRAELHGTGVRASAVLPTFAPTEMTEGLPLDGIPTTTADEVARAILRMVRRGGPATVAVPRWMGGLPRLAAFTPQAVQDLIRHGATRNYEQRVDRREAYTERLRRLVQRPPDTGPTASDRDA